MTDDDQAPQMTTSGAVGNTIWRDVPTRIYQALKEGQPLEISSIVEDTTALYYLDLVDEEYFAPGSSFVHVRLTTEKPQGDLHDAH